MSKMWKGSLLVICSAVLFGCMPLAAKTVYLHGGNPLTLTFLRNALALPVLFILMVKGGGDRRITPVRLLRLCVISLSFILTPLLLYSSYSYISSGMATTIHFVYPVLVVLGCMVVFKEKPNRVKLICVALCTLGIVLFYTPGEQSSLMGLGLSFASGVTYAFYILYLDKSGLTDLAPYALAFWLALVSSLELGIVGWVGDGFSFAMTGTGWALSVVFALGITVCATVCFQTGVRIVGPQRASILSTLEPATSILIGLLVYAEPFSLRTGAGVALILAAVLALTLFDRERAEGAEGKVE